MTYAQFARDITQEGDFWIVQVFQLGGSGAGMLAADVFPFGIPYGVTVNEEMTIEEPDLIGVFRFGGLDVDVTTHMAPEWSAAFHEAGLQGHRNTMSMEPTPDEGTVRTWFQGSDQPWDMPIEEAAEIYADNFTDVQIPEVTVWDPIDQQTITVVYANGSTLPVVLNTIEQSQTPASKLLNHNNFLIIPADDGLNPVLSARTCPNLFALRVELNEADARYKAQQIQIGELVNQFAKAIKDLAHGSRWKSPVDTFRDGLRK
jgi:hypothetical protein